MVLILVKLRVADHRGVVTGFQPIKEYLKALHTKAKASANSTDEAPDRDLRSRIARLESMSVEKLPMVRFLNGRSWSPRDAQLLIWFLVMSERRLLSPRNSKPHTRK